MLPPGRDGTFSSLGCTLGTQSDIGDCIRITGVTTTDYIGIILRTRHVREPKQLQKLTSCLETLSNTSGNSMAIYYSCTWLSTTFLHIVERSCKIDSQLPMPQEPRDEKRLWFTRELEADLHVHGGRQAFWLPIAVRTSLLPCFLWKASTGGGGGG